MQRIEEQRLTALLQEQRDAPVDVQVGGLWHLAAANWLAACLGDGRL